MKILVVIAVGWFGLALVATLLIVSAMKLSARSTRLPLRTDASQRSPRPSPRRLSRRNRPTGKTGGYPILVETPSRIRGGL